MQVLTLMEARDHLRIDDDAEDTYLSGLVLAAQAIVEDALGRPLFGAEGWSDVASLPSNIVHAIKLVLGELYAKREGAVDCWFVVPLVGRYCRVSVA